MTINLEQITKGLPGITPISGAHLLEGCVVCLKRHNHSNLGTPIIITGVCDAELTITWNDIYNEQLNRTWADQFYATEHGALCIAILLTLNITDYTVIERSIRNDGFDYWLGKKEDRLFQKKAKLEISGIYEGSKNDVLFRHNKKYNRFTGHNCHELPIYIGVVEFSKPMADFQLKQ